MFLILYIIIQILPNNIFQKILEWYREIFAVALFPVFLSWFLEKKDIKSFWNILLMLSTFVLCILGYIGDAEILKTISAFRTVLNVFVSLFITLFVETLISIRKENSMYCLKKLPQKGIRKDLYYRTPNLNVNISNIELRRCCENYFNEYIHRYKKIGDMHTVEYVKLTGIYSALWYKKTAFYMKLFVAISLFAITINIKSGILCKSYLGIGLLIIFCFLVGLYKVFDLEYLYKIGIRYFYDEWDII